MNKEKTKKFWIIITDGFNGILALMIYNFLLYISDIAIGIVKEMREKTGYFYLNTLIKLDLSETALVISLIFVFACAFLLGIIIGRVVRNSHTS